MVRQNPGAKATREFTKAMGKALTPKKKGKKKSTFSKVFKSLTK